MHLKCPANVILPQEFSEIPFLKKFKFQRQDRVFPKDARPAAPNPSSAAAVTSAAPSASAAASNNLTEVPAGQWLTETLRNTPVYLVVSHLKFLNSGYTHK